MTTTRAKYEAAQIETARQAAWAERDAFATPEPTPGARSIYIKPSSPFTSGKLHMGHVRDYSIGDAYARFRRARGDDVLFGFGFDAFGLPAEMAAIERKIPPADWVESCGERMLEQMRRLGFSFDYERVFYSSDEAQYRWSQWLFVTLLEAGLIYLDDTTVDWCDHCQTTLAALQVEDGTCWRCHNEVRLIRRPTWFLRITPYLEENDARLPELEQDWDEISLSTQRYILGRSDGVEVDLEGPDGKVFTVFTPYKDLVTASTFVLLSPRVPDLEGWPIEADVAKQLDELRSGGWERSARDAKSVPLVDTGLTARAPWTTEPLPIVVSPLVDARFGPTAALGIPEVDEADVALAERLERVPDFGADLAGVEPWPGARETVRYRAADFSISRQRFWGTPIPIVHCESCGPVPVPEQDLPVVLPRDIEPTGEGNPLAERSEFVDVACPRCGEPAKRETDTLDCHFDALWLWVPSAVPPAARAEQMFTHADLQRWLPSERLVAGADSGGFVFDQRVVTKALRDIGPFSFLEHGEPFSGCLFHEMVIADGRKMSKHLGNVVDPDALVEQYGADTVRLAVLYAAGPAKTLNWNDGALRFAARFLNSVWIYSQARFAGLETAPEDAEAAGDTAFMRERLCKWCDNGLNRITADLGELQMHKAVRNVTRLFERIQDFEKRVIQRRDAQLCRADAEAQVEALKLLAQTLAPFAPHVAEALLLAAGADDGEGLPGTWPERLVLAETPSGAAAAG
jgi:leucyl-tRNA synthetase